MNVLGSSYRLFYQEPLHAARGEGSFLYDADGEAYLDAYNNVASIGHANPAVAEAVARQMRTLSTHSRYLQEPLIDYAERLRDTFPAEIDRLMFTNSGSEANDLALRLARFVTGGMGVVVTTEAYHGTTIACAEVSPAAGGPSGLPEFVRAVTPPDTYRGEDLTADSVATAFAERVRAAFESLLAAGVKPAAFLFDSIFSSDGVYTTPGILAPAVAVAHEYGAVIIADEVQPGFGRTGSAFWGFARQGITPDLVTMGKPMGNGVPVAALAGRGEIINAFGAEVPYFNTFGGSSVPIAAAAAVLDQIQSRALHTHADELGARLHERLADLALAHHSIGDIRSAGLYFGVEIVADPTTKEPGTLLAGRIINAARANRLLISVCGPTSSTLKMRPMLTYTDHEADLLIERLDEAVTLAEAQG